MGDSGGQGRQWESGSPLTVGDSGGPLTPRGDSGSQGRQWESGETVGVRGDSGSQGRQCLP